MGEINFAIPYNLDLKKIELFNSYGELIWYSNNSPNIQFIDLSAYPSGAYFIKFTSEEEIILQRLILN